MASAEFEAEWARCKRWIEAALEHDSGTHTIEDVLELCLAGEATPVFGRRSAMVLQLGSYPQAKVLHFWLAGGDLAELRDELRPMAESWGRSQGCTKATITGRKGWVRALPEYEYVATICGKEL